MSGRNHILRQKGDQSSILNNSSKFHDGGGGNSSDNNTRLKPIQKDSAVNVLGGKVEWDKLVRHGNELTREKQRDF